MKSWFRFTEVSSGMTTHLFFEVEADKVIRQVEQYGDCWVYSGDTRSFCLDSEGMAVFGTRPQGDFSSLRDGELPASLESRRAEFEQGWSVIDAATFEAAWEAASRLAVSRSDTALPSGQRLGDGTIAVPTIPLQEKLVESMQAVVNACDLRLRNPNLAGEDRSYLEDLLARTQADLEIRRRGLERMRETQGQRTDEEGVIR